MSYAPIDSAIQTWVRKHDLKLFTHYGGSSREHRSVYLSSARGECFQIWVDEPNDDRVEVHAADVETEKDEEFRKDWSAPIAEVALILESAVSQVRAWMAR